MAWVVQRFDSEILSTSLFEKGVNLRHIEGDQVHIIMLHPLTRGDAHDAALVLRRAARRLEEIGKGLV